MIKLLQILEELQDRQYTVYCDMDGVIVDFEAAYTQLTGENPTTTSKKGDDFWTPVDKAGAGFWIRMKWMPDGKALWNYISKYQPILLSAPSRQESSRIGKRVWVKRNLPGVKLLLRQAERKQDFANPTSILIDDREDNIERWRKAGGIGIVHTSAADTIAQLKELGL